jgi:hypothetical protein
MTTSDMLPSVDIESPTTIERQLKIIGEAVDQRMDDIRQLNKRIMRLETGLMLAHGALRQPTPEVGAALHYLDYTLKQSLKMGEQT